METNRRKKKRRDIRIAVDDDDDDEEEEEEEEEEEKEEVVVAAAAKNRDRYTFTQQYLYLYGRIHRIRAARYNSSAEWGRNFRSRCHHSRRSLAHRR